MSAPRTIPANTSLLLVGTSSFSKTFILPTISTNPGRLLIFKDIYGSFSTSSVYLSTTGLDGFENNGSTMTLATNYGAWTFLNDAVTRWYLIDSYKNTMLVSTFNYPASGGGGGSVPQSISNLVMWLDATQITGVSNGGAVTSWTDSASGMVFNNVGNVTYLASGINSKPVVNIAGPGPYMQFSGTVPTISSGVGATIYAVIQNTAGGLVQPNFSGATFQVLWQMNNYSNGWEGYPYNFANSTQLGTLTNTRYGWSYPMATSAFQTAHILKVISGPSSWQQFFMSTSLGTYSTSVTGNTPGLASPIRLGACMDGPGLAYYCGYFAEVILYNRVLTSTEQTTIETYLKSKWGV